MPHVQTVIGTAANPSATTVTVTINVTAGSGRYIDFCVSCEHGSATVTVADNAAGGSNTYTEITGTGLPLLNTTPAWQMRRFRAPIDRGGNITVTATFSASVPFRACAASERSDLATSNVIDGASGLRQTTGTTRNAGSVSNTQDCDHAAFGQDYNAGTVPSVGSGFTDRGNGWSYGGNNSLRVEDRSVTGIASQSATFGMDTGADSYCTQVLWRLPVSAEKTPYQPWVQRGPVLAQ